MSKLILKLPPDEFVFDEWEILNDPFHPYICAHRKIINNNNTKIIITETHLKDYYYHSLYNYPYYSTKIDTSALNIKPELILSLFDIDCSRKISEFGEKYYPHHYLQRNSSESEDNFYTLINQPNSLQIAIQKCDDFFNFISNYHAFF